jgi:hypothetical protein
MSHDLCDVEEPYYLIVKEYEGKPKPEDLTEVFTVVYAHELPKWQIKEESDGVEYVFFTSLEKAWKRFKIEGPKRALIKRIFTDNDELIELARRNDNVEIPLESINIETASVVESPKDDGSTLAKIT